jgi:hypothetical protein
VQTILTGVIVPVVGVLVVAIDAGARAFYLHHGFESSPTDPLNLQMLTKDIRAAVERAGS